MVCPKCGADTLTSSGRCAPCDAQTPDAPTWAGPGAADVTRVGDDITSVPRASDMRAAVATGAGFTTDAPTLDGNQATLFGNEARTGDDDAVTGGVGAATAASDTGPLTPGQPFGTRYHLIRALGVGGMGAVYQAWDAELGVAVAIKVIRPEVMADPSAAAEVERRFKRELLLARQVTHKNVVRIHDLGEIDGIKYITMSYVEGGDLSSLLKREGRLPAATVLSIARQIVSPLVQPHKAGVAHSALKPANIMIV